MDIDLTADMKASTDIDKTMQRSLDKAFPRAAASLGYDHLVVKTSSVKKLPRKNIFETAKFPALQLKVGYAERGTSQEGAVDEGGPANVIGIDISFNEPKPATIQVLKLTGGDALLAYSAVDLIAEKYRAMLQQVLRNRNRRQDVYDLYLLLKDGSIDIDKKRKAEILDALLEKSRARDIEPNQESLDDPEIKQRSGADWNTLELELGKAPDFEACFKEAQEFYRSLPWSEQPQ